MVRPNIGLSRAFSRQRLVQYFFFAVFLFLMWQVLLLLAPFSIALLGSAILALMVHPMHDWVLRRMPKWPSIAAGISTVGAVLVVVVPILLLSMVTIKETSKVYPVVQEWVRDTPFFQEQPIIDRLPKRLTGLARRISKTVERWNIDLEEILLNNLDQLSQTMTRMATTFIKNTLFLIFNILVLTFTLFFFLRDGPYLIQRLVELVPMAPRNKSAVLNRLQVTLYAVIRGVFVVAILQGVLSGIGYSLFGVPFPVLLGVLTMFLAPIPFFGPATIWVPTSLGLAISGSYDNAVFIALWGLLLVSAVDNFVRPLLISADAKLPILLMFFGMLGGLKVYGFKGVLMGPVVIALFLAFMDIYRREYQWLLNPGEK